MSILDDVAKAGTDGEAAPTDYTSAPSYQVGADAHNYGNGNFAITDPSTWVDAAESVPSDVTKFIVGSAVSGLTSIANSGLTVGNWLGNQSDMIKTSDVLTGLDDDLGQYYQQHQHAEDLVGFIATSLLPGTAGVKVLNAGQKLLGASEAVGVGANIGRAVGLLPDAASKFATASASEIATASGSIATLNSSTLSALASGVGQQFLEGAAFTTAVQATMFKSPILDDQDGTDIVKNILVGGLLQGAIGGAFEAAKTFGVIKQAVTGADQVLQPSTFINELAATASPADRISQRLQDLSDIPQFKDLDDFTTNWLNRFPDAADVDSQALFNRYQANVANKSQRLNQLIQQDVSEITGGDADLTQQTSNTLATIDPVQAQGNIEQMLEAGRISTPLKIETQILNRAAGKGVLEDIDTEGPLAAGNKAIQYVKLSGDDSGVMTNLKPAPEALNLADTLQDSGAVANKVASYGFSPTDGFSLAAAKSADQIEARYVWAKNAALQAGTTVKADDIPLLEQAYLKQIPVNIKEADGSTSAISDPQEMLQHLQNVKNDAAQDMLADGKNTTAIAKATNVTRDSLEHTQSADPVQDLFARQTAADDYTKALIKAKLWDESKGTYPLDEKPSWMKVAYSTKAAKDVDGNTVQGMARIISQQKVAQQGFDNVFAKTVGDQTLSNRFIPIPKSILLKANRLGSGPGFVRFANGAYGSLSSITETIGKAVSDLQRTLKAANRTELEGPLYQLGTHPQAAVEFSAINEEIAATTEKYLMGQAADGSPQLIARSWKRYQDAIAAGKTADAPQIQQGARITIPIKNAETADAITTHIRVNGERLGSLKEIRAAQGLEDSKDAETFYPLRPDPKDYPHFAFVVDPTVTGAGHVKMIHAQDAGTLGKLIDKVPAPFRTITKDQSEEFHKTIDDYQWDRTLHENYIDSEIQSKGINSQFFPQTDPQAIVNKVLDFHMRGQDVLARELTNMKYSTEFAELRRLGDQFASSNTSKYGSSFKYAEDVTKNPYVDYIKTALNISRQNEFPLWQGLNTALDKNVSRIWGAVSDAFTAAKGPADLEGVNSALTTGGLKAPYMDAATNLLVNKSAQQGVLRGFVQKANALLATLTLRLDPLNSVNYAIGHQVLNGAETMSLLRAIKSGNPRVAGDLAALKGVQIPGVTDALSSPSKLIGNVFKDFVSEQKLPEGQQTLTNYFKANGWIKGDVEHFRSMLDDLSVTGNEDGVSLNKRMQAAFDKAKNLAEVGAKFSGSKLSEEFQGFAAAHVMKQMTDAGIAAGVIGRDQATAYINTFVNRVRGNMLASQRPVMFQGPIGQAIGLFQTYQFNILQQLLRHVAEGSGKDVATMLGLQGSIYGMQSLPAFNFINQHIVGTASGNPMHRDLYDATYGVLGKNAGDWLMYGIPSNLLRTNLYSRGDLNPRNMTVIPTSLSDVPIISSYGRFFDNLKQMASNISQGGNVWQSFLQGLEHNAISRPLAGLAQTLQAFTDGGYAYSTTAKGNILGANDVMNIATLARLSGGRPLDEALVNDATYRVATYQAADAAKRESLGQAMKTTMIAGGMPTPEQVHQFSSEYAAGGGNQTNFSKYMLSTMMRANVSQANRLATNLNSPYSQSMQQVMGGGYALDGTRMDPVSGLSYSSENPTQGQ